MEVMTRDLAAVTLRATTSETQCADLEKITIEQRTTAARTTVPQQGLGAQAGTFTTTTVNCLRRPPNLMVTRILGTRGDSDFFSFSQVEDTVVLLERLITR